MHDLNVALYRNHMVDPVATALIFVFYSLTSVVIYRHWYDYAKQCYENKKISYASKVVITALTTTLLVLTSILDILFVYISLREQKYFIYTKSMLLHIKLSWTTSVTFMNIVYLCNNLKSSYK